MMQLIEIDNQHLPSLDIYAFDLFRYSKVTRHAQGSRWLNTHWFIKAEFEIFIISLFKFIIWNFIRKLFYASFFKSTVCSI